MADYVKLPSSFALDIRVMALLGDMDAEGMLNRGRAYCGAAESAGFIPAAALPMLGVRKLKVSASKLVAVGLWREVEGGYEHVDWFDEQDALEELLERQREGARLRQQRHRAKSRDQNRDTSRDESVTVTGTHAVARDKTSELSTAAAALAKVPEDQLPTPVLVLRSKMSRLTALSVLIWDRMTLDQVGELIELIDTRGDDQLVAAAVRTTSADKSPVTVQAYFATWHSLPERGQRLGVVHEPCPDPDHIGMTLPCSACAADSKAAAS